MNTFLSSLRANRSWLRMREIVLFLAVGILNTAVDFAVLNLLIALTHYHGGPWLLVFNSISFLAAVINSYIWNGRITFRHHERGDAWRFLRFVALNAVGLGINSLTVWFMTPLMDTLFSIVVAVNVSKVLATVFSLIWNYISIKRWIFRAPPVKTHQPEQAVRSYSAAPGDGHTL